MKKSLSGRSVDLSGIDTKEIIDWMNSNNHTKGIIKCHTIISLYNGNSMQNVCAVFGVTRETIRKWKGLLRQGGVVALLNEGKVGKRSKIGAEKQKELKNLMKIEPIKYGYDEKKWTGQALKDFLEKNWNIKIGIRAAQLWLKQAR